MKLASKYSANSQPRTPFTLGNGSEDNNGFAEREARLRGWIARAESVCPYAPGLAHVTYLPPIDNLDQSLVHFLSGEMKAFYTAKENGKRVGRWLLLPHHEWNNHQHALKESETLFWGLNAAAANLRRDRKRVKQALARSLPGYQRQKNGNILNPIVGRLTTNSEGKPHPKSLFCSALSSHYQYEQYYRYAPTSVMVMIYAEEFQDHKERHTKAVSKINLEMIHSSLLEQLGTDLLCEKNELKGEIPRWEALISRILNLDSTDNASTCLHVVCQRWRELPEGIIEHSVRQAAQQLPLLTRLCHDKAVTAKQVLQAYFTETGLYTLPN